MVQAIVIGEWIEAESRELHHGISSYAADYEVLKTRPGRYPVTVTSSDGKTLPGGTVKTIYPTADGSYSYIVTPYWVHVSIDADRIAGGHYSGFGGGNFAFRELPKEPAPYRSQTYYYQLQKQVDSGKIELNETGKELLERFRQ